MPYKKGKYLAFIILKKYEMAQYYEKCTAR